MLVLSRKKDQTILFPTLGITLNVLRVKGTTVSVGIEAPQSIQVLRGELSQTLQAAKDDELLENSANNKESDPTVTHRLRNQLNEVFLAVALSQKQLSEGHAEQAEKTLQRAFETLLQLDQGIEIDSSDQDLTSETKSEAVQAVVGPDSRTPNTAGRRTLVVEDDPNERALLAGYLRVCGHNVSTAKDGVEALEILAREPMDLVVLDMRMPRMNGVETLEAIRKDPFLKDIEVVVVSGENSHSELSEADARGVSEWFSKPLDPNQLLKHLEASQN